MELGAFSRDADGVCDDVRQGYGRTIDALVAYLQKRGVEFLMQGSIGIKVVRIIEDEECEEEEDKKAKRKNSKAGGELAPNATDK
jgi:hypothetical protein